MLTTRGGRERGDKGEGLKTITTPILQWSRRGGEREGGREGERERETQKERERESYTNLIILTTNKLY